jgi:predicted dehydrogenase
MNNKKLKIGIIGCGNIFPMHAESIKQKCKNCADLVAVCDIKNDKLKSAVFKYKCKGYKNYKDMLNNEILDVVHICTPHYLHKEMSVYVASKKINIFLEKPMALNRYEADKIRQAVKTNNVKLNVCFQNRYNPSTKLAKKIIESGKAGKIISSKIIITWCKPDDYYLNSDWKGTWDKEGGGVVIDQAIHSIDIIRYLYNSPVDYVYTTIANRMHQKIKVEDEASGIIMFKSGAYVNLYAMNHYSYDDDLEIEIHLENALINIVKDSAAVTFKNSYKKIKSTPKKIGRASCRERV